MKLLIPEKETLEVEFKSDLARLSDSDLIDAVVAFANTRGGDLYLGVEDDGRITGLHASHRDSTQLAAFIANKTIPPISVRVETIPAEKAVLLIHVPQSRSIVASTAGKIQRRRIKADGTPENIPMYPYEITTRLSELSLLDFSAQPVPGAVPGDFDPLEIERLRHMVMAYHGEQTLLELADDELEKALQLVTSINGQMIPTYAGLLILGRQERIRELMPTAEAGFQMLRGTEVTVNESFYLPLLAAIERIVAFIDARNPEQEMEMGMFRVSVPEFDKRAVREAVVNAFVHRDYTRLGRVLVQMDGDGLSISNPGGFIEGVTYDNILTVEPHGRNPVLADALKRIGLAERTGRGVDRIYEGSLRFGRDLPDYSASTSVSVRLFIPRGMPDRGIVRMIADYQQKSGEPVPLNALFVLNMLKQNRRMNAEEMNRELHLPEAKLRATLERLAEAGLVEAMGSGRGRTYVLSARMYHDPAEYVRQTDIDLIRHKELIIKLTEQKGSVTRKDVVELLHVTPPQAYRLLQKLVKEDRLVLEGKNNAARYVFPS